MEECVPFTMFQRSHQFQAIHGHILILARKIEIAKRRKERKDLSQGGSKGFSAERARLIHTRNSKRCSRQVMIQNGSPELNKYC